MKTEQIEQIVARCDGSKRSITETVSRILQEDTDIKVGDTVACVDEDTTIGGFVGQGVVRSFSEDKTWADVELPNSSKVQSQTSLLYLCGK